MAIALSMKKILVVAALLASGCTKDGGAYVCSSEDGTFIAEARVSRFSGDVVRYKAVDYNGIGFDIDDDNSRSFECISKAEDDKRQTETAAKSKIECERGKKDGDPWFVGATC
jgi:hypothetical protein